MLKRVTFASACAIAASLVTAPAQAALRCEVIPHLVSAYLGNHYEHKDLTPALRERAATQLVRGLDPSRTLLTQEDVKRLEGEFRAFYSAAGVPDCNQLARSHQLVVTRVKEAEALVRTTLNDQYNLDETTQVIMDPEKRGFPKNLAERDAVLRKMVHFQISNYLLSDTPLAEAKTKLVHRYELITKRSSAKTTEELMVDALEAFAHALDPHSDYLSKDALADFQISMQLSLEGIGASLSNQDGYTVIEEIIPGGGAEKIGTLQPKDKIIAVAQGDGEWVNVIDMDLKDVVKMIRGKKGTRVRLTILRQAEKVERFEVAIIRDKIDLKDQAAKITYHDRKTAGGRKLKIGVIDFPSFYGGGGRGERSSYTDIRQLLLEAKKNRVDGVVLDMSRNGGGLLDDAVKIAGLFIQRGGVVATQTTGGSVEVLEDKDDDVVWSGPLVMHLSRVSASASEILAGALRDYGRGLVVGNDHTFGKGTVQSFAPLPADLGAMKVTTGMYFLPKGNTTQHTGVPADIRLPFGFNATKIGEKFLDYSLNPRTIPTFVSKDVNPAEGPARWRPIDAATVLKLDEASKKRVAASGKIAELTKKVAKAEGADGLVKLAELRQEIMADKKNEKRETADAKKKAKGRRANPEDDDLFAFTDEAINIAADLVELQSAVPAPTGQTASR